MGFLDSLFGASSLPSSPTGQQTSTSTPSIQPWAQPYISNYLNATQNLIANQQTPALLNQSYVDAAGLKLPGGFASGTALAEAGGKGSLSTAPIALDYGQRGADYGAQGVKYGDTGAAMGTAASRAGDMYAAQATDPAAMKAYMSPYMQNVVDYQKEQAVRDYQIQAPQMAAQAVGSGAFGGNRLALQQSEANRGLQNRLAGIEATGQQTAFEQARQAQQFGSQLGLQGLQAGMQGQQVGLQGLNTAMQGSQVGLQGVSGAQQGYAGATTAGGTLGNIAAQQAQAKIAQLQLQNQFGMQQQMFPYQQQQFAQQAMANLPFTSTSTTGQTFQAPPNTTSQLAGVGTTALGAYGLYKMFNKGGSVQGYADGGNVQDAYLSGQPMGIGQFEQDQIDLINQARAAAGTDGGMLGNATQAAGMFTGGNNMSPEAMTAMSAGLRGPSQQGLAGLMPAQGADNAAYVKSLYSGLLGRQADDAGYQHNLGLLSSGKINQQDLARAFLSSKEGQGISQRLPQLMGAGMPAASGLSDIRLNQLLGAR